MSAEVLASIEVDPLLSGLRQITKNRIVAMYSDLADHVANHAEHAETWESNSKAARKLTKERAEEKLALDPDTGALVWKITHRKGCVAGHRCIERGKAYIRVRIDDELIMAHAIVWLLTHGEFPYFELDHLNGDGTDNRPANLAKSNRLLNNSNTSKRKDGKANRNIVPLGGKYQVNVKYAKRIFTVGGVETVNAAVRVRDLLESLVPRGESHVSNTEKTA